MSKPPFDLSLYLVTDSGLVPPGRTFVSHVEEANRGRVIIVQLREKTLARAKFIELGLELHKVTREYNVPLLTNDRVDAALAVGCEGMHIGWDDCHGRASMRKSRCRC
jgi:thiamine-phosphate diphosphorylase/hydroxyethylthiazole kinase